MTVVGGAYREVCLRPRRAAFYGSGTTATIVLCSLGQTPRLYTALAADDEEDFRLAIAPYKIAADIVAVSQTLSFLYSTPLAIPQVFPRLDVVEPKSFPVRAERALVFGMLDALPQVHADEVVYDPQSGWRPRTYRSMGGVAARLAYVLNADELGLLLPGEDLSTAARKLARAEDAQVIVVKRGLAGALVFERGADAVTEVPAYRCGDSAHQIGSGDVFSAVFSYHWFGGASAPDAADAASRAVARYVTDGNPETVTDPAEAAPITPWRGKVYLAAPFFTLPQLWMVEEVRRYLHGVGVEPRSPLHDIGLGPAAEVAPKDLTMLSECGRVLALLDGRDPGTIFEVGYAADRGIEVWGVTTSFREAELEHGDLRMLLGSGVRIFDDLTAAIVDIAIDR